MTPSGFLSLVVLITAFTALIWRIDRRRRRRVYRRAASQWRVQYCAADQFGLAGHLIGRMPVPGAADFRVKDVMYWGEESTYHYLFTVEYTVGLVRGRRRLRCVMQLTEPHAPAAGRIETAAAPTDRSLLEQYRHFVQEKRPHAQPV